MTDARAQPPAATVHAARGSWLGYSILALGLVYGSNDLNSYPS